MPNYANGKIYTIRFNNSNDIYIGSTTQSLAVRFGEHKKDKTSLSYLIINKYNGDWSNCYYELYENYICNNREELNKKEGEIIRLFRNNNNYNCINNKLAGRTSKEHYIECKDTILERFKLYYIDNKDILKKNHKEYYEDNKEILLEKYKEKYICDCGSCLRIKDKARHEKTKKHQEYIKSIAP